MPTPFPAIACSFLTLLALSAPALADWHVPEKGSVERTEIMDALRTKMASFDPTNRDLVFVVHKLCISDQSGWIDVEPHSRDGESQFEPIQAVLVHNSTGWTVRQIACGEEECAKGTDADALRRSVAPRCP